MSYIEWTSVHAPAANTKATVTKAAVSNAIHVVSGFTATFVAGAAAPTAVTVTVSLLDGATTIWTGGMSLPATAGASAVPIIVTGIDLPGTINQNMKLEFSAAGGANTVEAVTLMGYSIVT